MNNLGLSFHHLGLAVAQPREAIAFLSELGYTIGPVLLDPLHQVYAHLATHTASPTVEIIFPEKADGAGPLHELVKKNPSGIVYHTCYSTTNLTNTLARINALGLHLFCLSEPKPAPLFGRGKVSFYKISGMGVVEILEPEE